jgi:integrase
LRSGRISSIRDKRIEDLTFHDTRGTAVTRLALAGASVPQIATFTGHSLKDVEAILEVHYLNRDPRMAEDALMRLEARVAASEREAETGT